MATTLVMGIGIDWEYLSILIKMVDKLQKNSKSLGLIWRKDSY